MSLSKEEFLQSVLQIIRNNQRAGAGLSAAALGLLISKSLPAKWNDFGFANLKLMLQELEARSKVRVGNNEKDALTVWAVESCAVPVSAEPTAHPTPLAYLRKEVWNAFVASLPYGSRYLERKTGEVRMGLFTPPTSDGSWTEITRITDDVQRLWMREFLAEKNVSIAGSIQEALQSTAWYFAVPKILRETNVSIEKEWNGVRSRRVTAVVFDWCAREGVAREVIIAQQSKGRKSAQAQSVPNSTAEFSARTQVLDALAKMETHELLALAIPAKYLISDRNV